MRHARFVIVAAVIAASAFAATPASADHDAICHGEGDIYAGVAGVDNPFFGPQKGVIVCTYETGLTPYWVNGVSVTNNGAGQTCLGLIVLNSTTALGCYP